jgi:hypothetical protein
LIPDVLGVLEGAGLVARRKGPGGHEEVRSTPRQDPRFRVEARFRELVPPPPPDELARLEARLLAEPCREPLVVWKEQGVLLDGHHRYDFLSLVGRDYPVVEHSFADVEAAAAWVWEVHYGRRSLTPECKSYLRGRQYNALKGKRGGDRRGGGAESRGATLNRAAEAVAQQFRVDRGTIYRDARFAAALDRVGEVSGEEVRQGVLGRRLRWGQGLIERLARLDPAEQRRVVEEALATGKRPVLRSGERQSTQLIQLPMGGSGDQAQILLHRLPWHRRTRRRPPGGCTTVPSARA